MAYFRSLAILDLAAGIIGYKRLRQGVDCRVGVPREQAAMAKGKLRRRHMLCQLMDTPRVGTAITSPESVRTLECSAAESSLAVFQNCGPHQQLSG